MAKMPDLIVKVIPEALSLSYVKAVNLHQKQEFKHHVPNMAFAWCKECRKDWPCPTFSTVYTEKGK